MPDIASLVPEGYAAYRPLVADGFVFFLERLAAPRRMAIVAEQLAMPASAPLTERVVALLRHCPTLHKMGQVVARDRRLDPELRRRLQLLESLPPPGDISEVLAIVRHESKGASYLEVGPQALAEASVAIVVPFAWPEPGVAEPRRGVFKVLKPGVEERLYEELGLWQALGAFLEERCGHYGLPVLPYRETLESVRRLLLNEIRLDLEQAHLAQAAQLYADFPAVLIPRLLHFSTPRMTAMERIHGSKVTDADATVGRRLRLADTIVEALVARPFWRDGGAPAMFHADPHAGNLFVTPEGRLAILDWSLVSHLHKAQREQVVQVVLGALMLDEAQVCRAVASLGRVAVPDEGALRSAVGDALGQVRRGVFPGFDWLLGLLDRLATSAVMVFPEEMVLFRKALLTLGGVVADVSAGCTTDHALMRAGMEQFLREFAGRALAPPDSRAFGSHLSNADLFGFWTALPFTASRFWVANLEDALAAVHAAAGGTAANPTWTGLRTEP